jgi:hypothetical protein
MRPLRTFLAFAMAIMVLLQVSLAEDFWLTKPYSQWSQSETEKMLRDSPWAKHTTLSRTGLLMALPQRTANVEREQEVTPTLTYTAQLRSAKPIRQAVVRERQLQEKYDGMSAAQKAALDSKTGPYLDAPQDEIVVYVKYDSNVRNYEDLVRRYWTQQTYDLVKNIVSLKAGEQWFSPTGYASANGAFQFNFPRPAKLPQDGSLILQFQHPALGVLISERVVLEFKLEKMLLNGVPAM